MYTTRVHVIVHQAFIYKKMKETKKQNKESQHGRYIEIIILLHTY